MNNKCKYKMRLLDICKYLKNLCYKKVKTFTIEKAVYYAVNEVEEILKDFSYENQIFVINAIYKTLISHKEAELKLKKIRNESFEKALKTSYLYEKDK